MLKILLDCLQAYHFDMHFMVACTLHKFADLQGAIFWYSVVERRTGLGKCRESFDAPSEISTWM